MSSGTASTMSAQQVIAMLSARANALRTSSSSTFSSNRSRLATGLNIARAWRGANPESSQLNAVTNALNRAYYTYQNQRSPSAQSAATSRQSTSSRTAATSRQSTSSRTAARASEVSSTASGKQSILDLPDQPDLEIGAGAGLIEAVRQTVSSEIRPGDILSVWNPKGPILERPVVKLALVAGGLFAATAITVWAVSAASSKKTEKPSE